MSRSDVYQSVTDRMIEALRNGTAPWRKPFTSGLPVNIQNGRSYRGVNVFLLLLTASWKSYNDPRWGTFAACQKVALAAAEKEGRELVAKTGRGGKVYWVEIVDGQEVFFPGGVKRGEKATWVILWKPEDANRFKQRKDADPDAVRRLFLKEYPVFNADQCEGIPPLASPGADLEPIEAARELVREYVSTGPMMQSVSGRAYYRANDDLVNVPPLVDFKEAEAYYSTLYHELVHSTGHKDRLDRLERTGFGSGPYAKEELVAEMGAAMLCGVAGIDDLDQSAAYVANWLGVLQDDPKFVVQAAAFAQRAADLILGVSFAKDEDEPNGEAEAGALALASS